MDESVLETSEPSTMKRGSPSLGGTGLEGDSPSREPGSRVTRHRETREGPGSTTVMEKPMPRTGTFGILSDPAPEAPTPPAQGAALDDKDRRRIRFENPERDETNGGEEPIVEAEQERSSARDTIAGKSRREFRMRFGLKRAKPQVEDSPASVNQEGNPAESPPADPADKAGPRKTRFSFPKFGFNRPEVQKDTDSSSRVLKGSATAEDLSETEGIVEEISKENASIEPGASEEAAKGGVSENLGSSNDSEGTKPTAQNSELDEKSEAQTETEAAGAEPVAITSSWWRPKRSGPNKDGKKGQPTIETDRTLPHDAIETKSITPEAVEQKEDKDEPPPKPEGGDDQSRKLRFPKRLQRSSQNTRAAGLVEPAADPAVNLSSNEKPPVDRDSEYKECLRLDVEPEEKAEEAIITKCGGDQEVFVSRLFLDRHLNQRRNAPPPSKPASSVFAHRSLGAKPGASAEIYESCLGKLGKTCQGLLGGLCLFFLILLLTAGGSQLKSLFGNSGGQGQTLQMLIYLLVIVSVITSFEGMNYQQIMAERRLNRFCITSVIYPAMLILGLTVMKLDTNLALESGVAENDWQKWRTVNVVRCGLGILAWMILCA